MKYEIFLSAIFALLFSSPIVYCSDIETTPTKRRYEFLGTPQERMDDISARELDEKERQIEARTRALDLQRVADDVLRMIIAYTEERSLASFNKNEKLTWNTYKDLIAEPYRKNYRHEVHYLNVKTGALVGEKDVLSFGSKYTYRNFTDDKTVNDDDIIALSLVIPNDLEDYQRPLAIYTHGGPNVNRLPTVYDELTTAFAALGYVVAIPNYRGSNGRGKQFENLIDEKFPERPIEDLEATLRYMENFNIDRNRTLLTGISFGTFLNTLALPSLSYHLSSAMLNKGMFDSKSRGVTSPVDGIAKSLSIFSAHGKRDETTPLIMRDEYISKLRARGHGNIETHTLGEGSHHLISHDRTKVLGITFKDGTYFDKNKKPLSMHAHIEQQSVAYNINELRDYVLHLVRFIDDNARNNGREFAPYSLQPKAAEKEQQQFVRTVWQKSLTNQLLKKVTKKVTKNGTKKNVDNVVVTKTPLVENGYSQTEAFLRIVLKNDYLENELAINLQKFLNYYSSRRKDIMEAYAKLFGEKGREEADAILAKNFDISTHFTRSFEIISAEKSHADKLVAYHGTDAELGFVYDIYSAFRRKLLMQDEGYAISRLRMLDAAFAKVLTAADLIKRTNELAAMEINKDTKYNYLPGFQDVAAAVQWSLFASFEYWGSSTYFRFFSEGKTGDSKSKNLLLREFFDAIGFAPGNNAHEHLVHHYDQLFAQHLNTNGGRLLQFFIDPSVVDEIAYLSEVFGYPLYLEDDVKKKVSCAPLEVLMTSMSNPMAYENLLAKNRDKFLHQDGRDQFSKQESTLFYANSVEGRMLMTPARIDNREAITIVDYFTEEPKQGRAKYLEAISQRVDDDIKQWFTLNPHPECYEDEEPKPALVRLLQYAEVGITGTKRAAANSDEKHSPFVLALLAQDIAALDYLKNGMATKAEVSDSLSTMLEGLLSKNKTIAAEWLMTNFTIENIAKVFCRMVDDKNFDAAQFLLDKKVDISTLTDARSRPIIFGWLKDGEDEKADWVLEQARISCQHTMLLKRAMYSALKDKDFITVDKLIARGADINNLHSPMIQIKGEEFVRQYLRAKDFAAVQWLFDNGIEANLESTFFHFASLNETEITKWIIDNYDFDPNDYVDRFKTFLNDQRYMHAKRIIACGFSLDKSGLVEDYLDQGELNIANWLCAQGASTNIAGKNGFYLLHTALANNDFDRANWLLEHGATAHAYYSDGSTILQSVIEENSAAAIWLIKHRLVSLPVDDRVMQFIKRYEIQLPLKE